MKRVIEKEIEGRKVEERKRGEVEELNDRGEGVKK